MHKAKLCLFAAAPTLIDTVPQALKRVGGEEGAGLPNISPVIIAGRITRSALVLVGLFFFALVVYAGNLWLTAGGNEEQVKKAQSVLKRAVIGILIVLFAGAITQFVLGRITSPVVPG